MRYERRMKTLRWWVLGLVIAALATVDVAPQLVLAQDTVVVSADGDMLLAQVKKKRRTLMDLLFGDKEERQPQAQPQAPVQQPQAAPKAQPQKVVPKKAAPKPQPVAKAPPPKPKTPKAPNAIRVAVFGDSLAVDLAGGLDRFYAEDPNLAIINMGVGSSGFVRDDFFNWNAEIAKQIAAKTFDLAVVIIGVNDRQTLTSGGKGYKPFTEGWNTAYTARLNGVLNQLRAAGKPTIWVGLPPVTGSDYSAALQQISAMQRLASFSGGAEFVDIYEKFADEDGKYTSYGPDLNGQRVRMRRDDGIHFSTDGADKLAFYLSQSIKLFYRGGSVSIAVADPLSGTDAAAMVRPPYQGLGQTRLLEIAGAVVPLSNEPPRAADLLTASMLPAPEPAFDLAALVAAPIGRVDAFGVGFDPSATVSGWLPEQ